MQLQSIEHHKAFGGHWQRYRHDSEACQCEMKFSVFLPSGVEQGKSHALPVIFWLSGLTCTDENFVQKSFAEAAAAEAGLILVVPDTSPRGCDIEGEEESYDLGTGAGFYLDASEEPWAAHYRMESYIASELYDTVMAAFPVDHNRVGLMGHSMGGHGALTLGLKYPEKFHSVSVFSPICNPSAVPWGKKAFTAYLGHDKGHWKRHDACELIENGARLPHLLVDQGMDDEFLASQLMPEALDTVCRNAGIPLDLRRHSGYDHSYFFIRSFIADHIRYHQSRWSV